MKNKNIEDKFADPNCPICEGSGKVEVEIVNHPDNGGIRTEKDFCECVVKNLEKNKKS